jgi:hypothetical protein
MSEIIHDLAPGASLMFRTAFRSEPDFAQGIGDLRNCGAKVIVDDIFYFDEPVFQDGMIAQAASAAAAAGVSYFTLAGNDGTFGVDAIYQPLNTSGGEFHDFGGGKVLAEIDVPPGGTITLTLEWNEPFDGLLGPGASSDFDLFLYSCNATQCFPVQSSTSAQRLRAVRRRRRSR